MSSLLLPAGFSLLALCFLGSLTGHPANPWIAALIASIPATGIAMRMSWMRSRVPAVSATLGALLGGAYPVLSTLFSSPDTDQWPWVWGVALSCATLAGVAAGLLTAFLVGEVPRQAQPDTVPKEGPAERAGMRPIVVVLLLVGLIMATVWAMIPSGAGVVGETGIAKAKSVTITNASGYTRLTDAGELLKLFESSEQVASPVDIGSLPREFSFGFNLSRTRSVELAGWRTGDSVVLTRWPPPSSRPTYYTIPYAPLVDRLPFLLPVGVGLAHTADTGMVPEVSLPTALLKNIDTYTYCTLAVPPGAGVAVLKSIEFAGDPFGNGTLVLRFTMDSVNTQVDSMAQGLTNALLLGRRDWTWHFYLDDEELSPIRGDW